MKYISVRWRSRYYASLGNNYLQNLESNSGAAHLIEETADLQISPLLNIQEKDSMDDPFLFQRNNAAELFIVRHADAIPDEDEIIPSGIYDDLPLSRIGREQAQTLAERLSSLSFDALYSSPLRRCLETAAPLAERLGMIPIIDEGLKEIKLGNIRPLPDEGQDLAALSKALQERQLDIVRIAGVTGHWDVIPDSEPSTAFRTRVVETLDEIASNHIGQRVLAFAHGGVINAYVAEVLKLQKDFFFPAANTSITVVRASGKHRVLYVLNDIGHLKREMYSEIQ